MSNQNLFSKSKRKHQVPDFITGILGRTKMVTAIAALVVCAVVVSIGAVVAAVYVNLSANTEHVALASQ